MTGPSRSCI